MAYLHSAPSRRLGMGHRLYAAWTIYRATQRQEALRRETSRQLGTLSERQLDDIGVLRREVDNSARDYLHFR